MKFQFMTEDEVISSAYKILESRVLKSDCIARSQDLADLMRLRLSGREQEVFTVTFLSAKRQIITIEDMFTGTLCGASVHPREVVKSALKHNCDSIIVSHNHPSNETRPSDADIAITRRLRDALQLVDITLLDHIIVSKTSSYSFAENRNVL